MNGIPTVKCRDAKYEDKGKLLEFDDGSEWFSPIIGVSGDAVRTEVGVFNKNDIVCISRLKLPGTQYSGLYRSDQHPLVFRPERNESARVDSFLNGTFKGKLSRRELLITTERLQKECSKRDIDENWIINRLIAECDNGRNKGIERLEAIKILSRIMGVEIGGIQMPQRGQIPVFGQFNLTVQDGRRQNRIVQGELQRAVSLAKTEYEIIDRAERPDKPKEQALVNGD